MASGCRASNDASIAEKPQPGPAAFSDEQSLSRDASEIARASGEDPIVVRERLDFQIRSGPAVGVLRRIYGDRLVGISRFATEEGFAIRVLLQGLDPAPALPKTAESDGVDVIVDVGTRFTEQQLRSLVSSKQHLLIESVPTFLSAFVEERTGSIVAFLRPADGRSPSEDQRKVEEILETKVVVRHSTGRFESLSMAGSGRHVGSGVGRPGCTGSFPARRGRQSGVLSAAHCENDNVYYNGVDGEAYRLSVPQESWTPSTDVQFMIGRSLAK